MGPIEVPIHGFLANPIPVGMVTPARPYAEAAQGAGGPVEVPNSCTSVRPIPITELCGRRVHANHFRKGLEWESSERSTECRTAGTKKPIGN